MKNIIIATIIYSFILIGLWTFQFPQYPCIFTLCFSPIIWLMAFAVEESGKIK